MSSAAAACVLGGGGSDQCTYKYVYWYGED